MGPVQPAPARGEERPGDVLGVLEQRPATEAIVYGTPRTAAAIAAVGPLVRPWSRPAP